MCLVGSGGGREGKRPTSATRSSSGWTSGFLAFPSPARVSSGPLAFVPLEPGAAWGEKRPS